MQSPPNSRERTEKELERLEARLRPFLIGQMRRIYGVSWQQEAQKSLHHPHWTKRGHLHLDRAALLYVLQDQWEHIFQRSMGAAERAAINEVIRMRNKLSHQWNITDPEVERLQQHIERLLTWIDSRYSFSQPGFTQARKPDPFPWWNSSSRPGFAQASTTDLPPWSEETRRKVRRRALLIGLGCVLFVGVPWCAYAQQGTYNAPLPDPTATEEPPTPTPFNQPLFTYTKHAKPVNALAWSPDGKWIASGSDDTTVQIWQPDNGTTLFVYHGNTDAVRAVAWSPDGQRIVSGSADNQVQVWDSSNGTLSFSYSRHSDSVNTLAWSPDGKWIASGSNDTTVQVWNASDGTQVANYTGHAQGVTSVTWSPDSTLIASSSEDMTVQVWVHTG
jgi:WD40 repeat protein